MKPQDISIKENIYRLAVPERARAIDKLEYGQAFKQFVELFGAQFDELKKKEEDFPRIVDVDECPPELLPFLGDLIGFDFDYTVDVELQREQMKTLVRMYREKGTPTSILDIVYKYDPRAVIFEPYEWVARFNVGKHSGRFRYANRTYWNTGVFEIRMFDGSPEKMREEVLKLRPAGTRMWVHYTHEFELDSSNPLEGSFISRIDSFGMTVHVAMVLHHSHALSGTLRGGRQKLSGSTFAFPGNTISYELEAPGYRIYAPNPLYTWEELLESNPGAEPDDPVYTLGRDTSVAKSLDMEAAYPEGTFEVPEGGFETTASVTMDVSLHAGAEKLEAEPVLELGVQSARRKITGTPLYTYDMLAVPHAQIDTVYPDDPEYAGSHTVAEYRNLIVGSFIEYQDDVQITITT